MATAGPSEPRSRPAPFLCPDCSSSFSRKEYVERHRRLKHLSLRPFPCTDCAASFARSDLLKRHRKTCAGVLAALDAEDAARAAAASGSIATGSPHEPALKQVKLEPVDNPGFGTSLPLFPPAAQDFTLFPLPLPTTSPSYQSIASSGSLSSSLNSNSPPFSLSSASTSSSSNPSPESSNSPPTPLMGLSTSDFSSSLFPQANASGLSGAEQTLAPPLFNWEAYGKPPQQQKPGLTPDEILAGQVLEELMKGPQNTHCSPEQINEISQNTYFSNPSPPSPPSSSLQPAHSQYEGIEFTPEAQALADYFNRGGVGGITALDLGFTYQPSLYQDSIFTDQPRYHEGEEKYAVHKDRFHISYTAPYLVPSPAELSGYAKDAVEKFIPGAPVVHGPTMNINTLPKMVAFAITVVGATMSKEAPKMGESETDAAKFSNKLLLNKRVHLVNGFNAPTADFEERFSYLQSLLLYQLLGLFHREEEQRLLTQTFHGSLIMMLRQLDLINLLKTAPIPLIHSGLSGEELEKTWNAWIKIETWRRVAFTAFLCDIEMTTKFDTTPLLPFSSLCIDLPSSDQLWNAPNSATWLSLYLSSSTSRPLPFVDALRVLVLPSSPHPYSNDGIVLSEISRLSTFPLLVLSRTLSYLEEKTEKEGRERNPIDELMMSLGAGLEFGGQKERENREYLERIKIGRERLFSVPGGRLRGGGEKWLESVIPQQAHVVEIPESW